MSSNVHESVIEIISEQLSVPVAQITLESTLSTLGADSLDVVELIMRFEDQFDIEIRDEDVEHLKTVNDVVSYLEGLIAAQKSAE